MKNGTSRISRQQRGSRICFQFVGFAMTVLALLWATPWGEATEVPFTAHTISTAANGGRCVFAADADSDGDMDVLSASYLDHTIAWYENDGASTPSFTEHVISTSADQAVSVFATDVDGDGDMDVLSASANDDKVAWYENDGGSPPSFTERVISTTADGAWCVFAADVDSDGDMDVLSALYYGNKIAWYESDGGSPPSFTERVISTSAGGAYSVLAADVDSDGDTDVLSASISDDKIAWYENDGGSPPSFTERVISTAADGATSVFAADVDGDGDMDVLSGSLDDDKVAWYENDGGSPPSFTERVISTAGNGTFSVFAADVDGDGDVDVLSASYFDNEIAWYENAGTSPPSFTRRLISANALQAFCVFAADVDGEGDLDILSASFFDDKIAWYENKTIHRSAAFPAQAVISTSADMTYSAVSADVDGDGDTDVLSACDGNDKIAWYENDGGSPPSFTEHVISTSADSAFSVFAADVDGDGEMDVLSASAGDDKIAWYENDGGSPPSFTERVISTSADIARSVFAADVDGDGDMDVLSASDNDDKIAWYESDGGSPPSFTERVISTSADNAMSVFAADVDGDGDTDALSASSEDDKIAWYENDGASPPSFTERVISTSADGAVSAFAADVDSDGDTDVLCASFYDDKIAWYENDGGSPPSFTQRVISTARDGPFCVVGGDVDGDGDTDVLSASSYDHDIAWYESDGGSPPSFTERTIYTRARMARAVFAADLDGDGDMDAGSASEFDDKIAWYENKGGQFALPTTDSGPSRMFNSEIGDLLTTVATHNGRGGDNYVVLDTMEILFEETPGDPLSSAEANALIDYLFVCVDDGSGDFEPSIDAVTAITSTLSLVSGVQTLAFIGTDPNVHVPYGGPKTYFVAVVLTPDAASQTPNTFTITHLTQTTSTAKDPNDIPLSLEYAANVRSTTVIVLSGLPPSFKVDDQFGQTVLSVSSDGDLFLTGNVMANAGSISSTTSSEVLVKDSGGAVVARIETTTGDLDLAGSITTRQGSITPTSAGEFIVKDGGGSVVAYISAAGDMIIKGDVHEGFVFP